MAYTWVTTGPIKPMTCKATIKKKRKTPETTHHGKPFALTGFSEGGERRGRPEGIAKLVGSGLPVWVGKDESQDQKGRGGHPSLGQRD